MLHMPGNEQHVATIVLTPQGPSIKYADSPDARRQLIGILIGLTEALREQRVQDLLAGHAGPKLVEVVKAENGVNHG